MYLHLHNLSLTLGDNPIFRHLDAKLPVNNCLFLLGPNGAGKTILLNLINGLIKPDHGKTSFIPRVKRTSFIFQRPIFLNRSVWQNLIFPLHGYLGRFIPPAQLAVAEKLLAEYNLTSLRHHLATSLSGGEQQRLAMAQALVINPDMLLMDEPTSHLDHESTAQFEHLTRRALSQGRRVIFVSHDLNQAKRLADHVVFMNKGQIISYQKNPDFFTKPKNALQEKFLSGNLLT